MKTNEAVWDRILRIIVGLFLISLTFWGPHSAWGWIGLLPLLTGVFGFCPLYALIGISTCKIKAKEGTAEHQST